NRGVEIDSDVADGPHSVILDQVTNGVAVRMAVLYLLAGGRPDLAEAAKGGSDRGGIGDRAAGIGNRAIPACGPEGMRGSGCGERWWEAGACSGALATVRREGRSGGRGRQG